MHLLPEETLFLVDRGALALAVDDVPEASLQQTFILAAAAGVTVTQYQVYAHLRRLGFIVNRTGASWHALPPPPPRPDDEHDDDDDGDVVDVQRHASTAREAPTDGAAAAHRVHPLAVLFRAWERTRATAVGWLRRLVSTPPLPLSSDSEELRIPPPPAASLPAEVQPLFQPGTAQLTSGKAQPLVWASR
jgi:hypothetical protein